MSGDMEFRIEGLSEFQAKLGQLLDGVTGPGLEAIIERATLRAHRYASMVVHVDTGRLKNSLHPRVARQANNVYGVVGTNVFYAPFEHARGGEHAFFERTVKEDGQGIIEQVRRDVHRARQEAGL